jgi:hypothetical protein
MVYRGDRSKTISNARRLFICNTFNHQLINTWNFKTLKCANSVIKIFSHLQELFMKIISSLAAASIGILLSSATWAIDSDAHSTHHPDAASSSSKSTKVDTKTTAKSESKMHDAMAHESMEKMDSQMKVMNDMHEKMMNAKTPDERKALMAEHMKAMQTGMALMSNMSKSCDMSMMDNMSKASTDQDTKSGMHDGMKGGMGTNMKMHHEMMEKRMQMMETMMQMMMDRMTP